MKVYFKRGVPLWGKRVERKRKDLFSIICKGALPEKGNGKKWS